MDKRTQIAFTADRNGQPVAYYWSLSQMRWFRIGLDAAKLKVATGSAREVRYVKNGR